MELNCEVLKAYFNIQRVKFLKAAMDFRSQMKHALIKRP